MLTNRELLIATLQDLIFCRHSIFDNIVHLAMSGELNHLNDAVDVGETYSFNLNHFRGLKDKNVTTLVSVCEDLEQKILFLMTENNISEDDLKFECSGD